MESAVRPKIYHTGSRQRAAASRHLVSVRDICVLCVQIGADGRRSQIFLAMSTAAEFRDHLSGFSDYYASLGPPNPDNVPDDGKLKSEMMLKVTPRSN